MCPHVFVANSHRAIGIIEGLMHKGISTSKMRVQIRFPFELFLLPLEDPWERPEVVV